VSMSTSEPGRGKRPRSQRGAVEDRWRKRGKDEHGNTIEVPSAVAGKVTRWRARYVENAGKEHTRHFDRKVDAPEMAQGGDGFHRSRRPCCTEGGEADSRGVERQVA
jgi:hypothetical protein